MNTPSLINLISVPTFHGVKTIEIYSGDIVNSELLTDVLVVSAFEENYQPRTQTLIGSLYFDKGIDIKKLSLAPQIDLRKPLNCWLSVAIPDNNIKRVLCIEALSKNEDLEERFTDLFACLSLIDYKGISTKSIMMPLLGTGKQHDNLSTILKALVPLAIEALEKNVHLETIYFIDKEKNRAELIDQSINKILERVEEQQQEMMSSQLFDLYNEVLKKLLRIKSSKKKFLNNNSINNLISKILSKDIRFYEIGILSRKIMELLLRDLTEVDGINSLHEQINHLQTKYKVATWMTSYMYILKNLSNYAAHESHPSIFPKNIDDKDRLMFSYSLNRFLGFYLEFKDKHIKN